MVLAKAEADKVRAEIIKILADARVKTEDMSLKDDRERDKFEGDQMLKAAEIDAQLRRGGRHGRDPCSVDGPAYADGQWGPPQAGASGEPQPPTEPAPGGSSPRNTRRVSRPETASAAQDGAWSWPTPASGRRPASRITWRWRTGRVKPDRCSATASSVRRSRNLRRSLIDTAVSLACRRAESGRVAQQGQSDRRTGRRVAQQWFPISR